MRHAFRFLPALVLLGLTACGGNVLPPEIIVPDEQGRGDNNPDECDPAVYPCGPYGYQVGTVIENISLPGLRDENLNGRLDDDTPTNIELAEYFQNPAYKAIVITSSAEWCEPCNYEQPGLVSLYNKYRGAEKQVAIFEAVIEDVAGKPASFAVATRWAKKHGLNFDLTIDPTRKLAPYYDINAFPMNMVVRTRDMKITWQKNGLAEAELQRAVEAILAED